MAITRDPAKMLELVRSGFAFCAKHTNQQKKLVMRFVGNYYREGMRTEPTPENMLLGFQASIVPQLCFDNPQVKIKAHRPVSGKDIAKWMQMACNQWIQLRDIVDDLERVAVDSLYSFGVIKVGVEPIHRHTPEPGQDEVTERMQPHMPFLTHVPNTDYAFDPEAKQWEYRRWECMRLVRDLEDVQNDETYDPVARAAVKASYDAGKDAGRLFAPERTPVDQDRVELFEVYYTETQEIGVLCEAGREGAVWLRPPEKRQGPGSPYVLVGGYYVPGSPIPAAIMALTADQLAELNAHASAAGKEEANRKSIVIANSDNPTANAAIRRSRNGDVVEIKGFDARSLQSITIGGTSSERLQFVAYLRDRLDQMIGASDAIRGNAQGVTATEASIAQANASIRVQLLQRHWRRGVREALNKVCWYLFNDPAVVMHVPMTRPDGQEGEGLFLGGIQPGQEDMDWTQYNLSIEPLSMARVDPQRQAAIAKLALDVAIAIAPLVPQFPWIRWNVLLDQLGEAHDIEGFADMIMDQQALVQAMLMGMAAPIPPTGQPRQGSVPGNANPQLRAMFPPSEGMFPPSGGMMPMGGGMMPMGGGNPPITDSAPAIPQPSIPGVPATARPRSAS